MDEMDEVVSQALKLAAQACCFGPDGGDCDRCVAPVHCDAWRGQVVSVAHHIAAFLRAPDVWAAVMEDYEAVTVAVERAAGES